MGLDDPASVCLLRQLWSIWPLRDEGVIPSLGHGPPRYSFGDSEGVPSLVPLFPLVALVTRAPSPAIGPICWQWLLPSRALVARIVQQPESVSRDGDVITRSRSMHLYPHTHLGVISEDGSGPHAFEGGHAPTASMIPFRSQGEALARAQFAARRDPHDCALLYAALGKKSLLQGKLGSSPYNYLRTPSS